MLTWVRLFNLSTGTGMVGVKKQAKSLLFFSNFSWWNTHLKKNGPKEFLTIRDVLEIFPCTFTSYDNTSSFCTRWMLCCVCAFSIASLARQTLACLSYIVGLLVRIRLDQILCGPWCDLGFNVFSSNSSGKVTEFQMPFRFVILIGCTISPAKSMTASARLTLCG